MAKKSSEKAKSVSGLATESQPASSAEIQESLSSGFVTIQVPLTEYPFPPTHAEMLGVESPGRTAGLQRWCIPEHLRNHDLLRRNFYTLPLKLLELIEREAPSFISNCDVWRIERAAAELCGGHYAVVGVSHGNPLQCELLRPQQPMQMPAELLKQMGWGDFNQAKAASLTRNEQGSTGRFNQVARAYAGWLNSNPQFCEERQSILADSPHHVSLVSGFKADASGESQPTQAQAFLVRWRLLELAGPRLPVPLRPLLSGSFPVSILGQLMDTGGLFNFPDTFPIPSRDELRQLLEGAIRREIPAHLQGWMNLIRSNNPSKTSIEKYSRQFEVHHYWALLRERHGGQLRGNVTKLQLAFASFFDVSVDSIKADLRVAIER